MTSVKADIQAYLAFTRTNGIQGGRVAITPHVLLFKWIYFRTDHPCDESDNPERRRSYSVRKRHLVYLTTKQRAIATNGRGLGEGTGCCNSNNSDIRREKGACECSITLKCLYVTHPFSEPPHVFGIMSGRAGEINLHV